MQEDPLKLSQHQTIRNVLRVAGPVCLLIGILFLATGMFSFFSAFGTGTFPRYFWCCFVGMPLIALGAALCKLGYMGVFMRYIAGESAPVAKDTINYVAEGTKPGIKAVAQAITEGVREASQPEKPSQPE